MACKVYTIEEKAYLVTHEDDTKGFYERFGYAFNMPNYKRARQKILDDMSNATLLLELCNNAEEKYQEKAQKAMDLTEEVKTLKATIKGLKTQVTNAKNRTGYFERENEKLKAEIKGLQDELEKATDIFTTNEVGYTNRELIYRRIAKKYKEKCESCPLRKKPKKIDGIWMD